MPGSHPCVLLSPVVTAASVLFLIRRAHITDGTSTRLQAKDLLGGGRDEQMIKLETGLPDADKLIC